MGYEFVGLIFEGAYFRNFTVLRLDYWLCIIPQPSCSKANYLYPGVKFYLGFLFFFSKAFSWIIFSILFIASNYKIVGKKSLTEFCTKPGS